MLVYKKGADRILLYTQKPLAHKVYLTCPSGETTTEACFALKKQRGGYLMFPYFWNSPGTAGVYSAGLVGRKEEELGNLPEEVRESIERHKDEFRTQGDIQNFIQDLNMKK